MTDIANPMATVPLLTTLSLAVNSSVDLFDMVKNTMCWQFGDEKSRALKALLQLSPTEALLFVNDPTVAGKMMSEPIIHLSGPLTASFSDGAGYITEYVRVHCSMGVPLAYTVRDMENLMRELSDPPGFQHCTFFCHNSSMTVHLPTSTQATAMQTKLSTMSGILSSCVVSAGDHTCVEMFWSSPTPLSEVLGRLRRSGIALHTVLQSILCLGGNQACIVGVTVLPKAAFASSSAMDSSTDLVLICCTAEDAAVVRARGSFALGSAGTLHVCIDGKVVTGPESCADQESEAVFAPPTAAVSSYTASVPAPASSMGPLLGGGSHSHSALRGILKPQSSAATQSAHTAPSYTPSMPTARSGLGDSTQLPFSLSRSDCYIFWDMVACPMFHAPSAEHEDDASCLVRNIETMMTFALPKHRHIMLKSSEASNIVFIADADASTADSMDRVGSRSFPLNCFCDVHVMSYP